MSRNRFGENLKLLRTFKGLSQKELGNKLGLAESTIGMYEKGKRQPDHNKLIEIAVFFDIDIDSLLRWQVVPTKDYDHNKDTLSSREKNARYEVLRVLYDIESAIDSGDDEIINAVMNATQKIIKSYQSKAH
ncbi:helix-turn-helix domain-containing protein [Bacillus velezensis]|uniref:helix-turn-helix domain-containing protein n=1 Tax=Bacillus velezensis TaxID=492670 RepID=UPI00119D0D0E|nr:helix-turn-helix transcriptional regulator [Bacillus velezensis]